MKQIRRKALASSEPATKGPDAERRRGLRYRVGLPMVFRWDGSTNNRFQADGVTRDISTTGAYVLAPTCPPANAVIDVEVYLLGFRRPDSRITARMKVLRVEHDTTVPGPIGFSIVGDGFQV
jgi:PilZ domain